MTHRKTGRPQEKIRGQNRGQGHAEGGEQAMQGDLHVVPSCSAGRGASPVIDRKHTWHGKLLSKGKLDWGYRKKRKKSGTLKRASKRPTLWKSEHMRSRGYYHGLLGRDV